MPPKRELRGRAPPWHVADRHALQALPRRRLPADITQEVLGIDRAQLIVRARHPLSRRAILPKGTGPFEHMKSVFARQNLALPNVVVETRSVMALKSLIGHSGFLGWMPVPMYDAERKARLIDALDIPRASDRRILTAFRRRVGMLPGPSVKLLEELRALTAT